MRDILLALGALLPVISSGVYMRSIMQGESRPQRMTRLLMLVIAALSLVSLRAGHDTSGIWIALTDLVQALLIFGLSWRWGMGGRSRLDFVCLGLCAIGVSLWLVSGRSLLGLSTSILADLVACVPSLHKTMRWPHTESLPFYAIDVVAAGCIVLAGPYAWRSALFPAYLVAINMAFVVVIVMGKRRRGPAPIPPTPLG